MPATVVLPSASDDLKLHLLDISVGGLGLWSQRGRANLAAGDQVELELVLGGKPARVEVVIRHASPDHTLHGVEFVDLSDEARAIVNRYVTELTERGASV
jgi:c-di-GMP-binding flagellar brake protein YcgR